MRPVRLELEGFTSFRQNTVIDFTDLDLFAITGATGAGKTSLIDSILFALYGRTPRVRNATELISQGSPELKVLLEFRAGGHLFRAFRQAKRKGTGAQRLDQKTGVDWETLADKSKGVETKVHELLGLDFDGFTKTVVLPQGEFDRFLRGEASKRREILIELLGLEVYARMMRKANESASQQGERAKLLEDHINRQLAGLSPERIEELESQLTAAHERIGAHQRELERIEVALPLQRRAREVRQWIVQRDTAMAEFNPIADKQLQLAAVLEESRAELQQYEDSAAEARERLEQMEALGSPDLLRRMAADIRKAQVRRLEIAKLKEALAKQIQELSSVSRQYEESAVLVAAANEAVLEAIQGNAADQIREHLHIGDECPVCEQVVLMIPQSKSSGTVEAARQASADAQKAHISLQKRRDACATGVKGLDVQIKSGEKDAVDTSEDPDALESKAADVESARVEFRKIESGLAARRKAVDLARDRLAETRTRFELLQQKLASLRVQLEGIESIEDLERQLGDLASVDLEAERKRSTASLHSMQKTAAQAEAALEQAARLLREADAKKSEIVELKRTAETARKLGVLLQENRFQTFVLSQTVRRLAVEGTRQLMYLSTNRYSFATNGDEFLVVDHWNADDKRSVNTLSGGESFLASLSLALALSKSLPDFAVDREAVHLDSLFLDEGFSTLDTETMQIVLDAIELLQAGGRMIGVVSHIPELAERMPARIEVSKAPGGSTIVIR